MHNASTALSAALLLLSSSCHLITRGSPPPGSLPLSFVHPPHMVYTWRTPSPPPAHLPTRCGRSALHWAAYHGLNELAEDLLREASAQVDVEDASQ